MMIYFCTKVLYNLIFKHFCNTVRCGFVRNKNILP